MICGGSSVVECLLAKEKVGGSNPLRRSKERLRKFDNAWLGYAYKSAPPLKIEQT